MSNHRGLVQRIERRLEATVGDTFARLFGGSIVPQEVEALLRREADGGVRPVPGNRFLVPNEYIITLGVHDFEKVRADPGLTSSAFERYLADYIDEQGWQTYGQVVVRFEQTPNLHTGQFRARGAVNPDAKPRPTVDDPLRPQSNHAFGAERGVVAMTDNSSYRGDQGQGRPGDEYYDDRYGRPQDDSQGAPERPAGPDPRAGHRPDQGGYPPPAGYSPPRPPDQGGYPDPQRGGYPEQGGYPDPRGYQEQRGYQDHGGYPQSYEQRPPGYGGPSYDQGFRQGGYGPHDGGPHDGGPPGGNPPGGNPPGGVQQGYGRGYGDYGRGPGRPDEGGGFAAQQGPQQQRPAYSDQGGYDQGYQQGGQGYNRPDYGQGDPAQYAEGVPGGGYAPQAPQGAGYSETSNRDYDQQPDYNQQPDYGQDVEYGQYGDYAQQPGGYDGYGQAGYGAPGTVVILQLDDGSGRTYQLREGSNIVGRGQDAQFRLPDTGVSRRHLEIRWDRQVALLSDLNSTNGTTVNNAPVQEWQLADGDVIRLGHSEIIVRIH
ncbi:FhaA domain-containing protein [Mycobacterium sp. THU-M104]|uniref:DUF3662 and FHA domain-containing protein n=1 Tax=Mycobacterium sp. THU-M104 TaxID=3410515 RepID=UPI003B9A10FB